jgi:hypothetical protein
VKRENITTTTTQTQPLNLQLKTTTSRRIKEGGLEKEEKREKNQYN